MIRKTLFAAFLVPTAAFAEAEKFPLEVDPVQNLAFCGSQVAALAWFYQGVVNDGSPELQPELDGLLAMQSIFITRVEDDGEKTIALFKRMTKASVNDLADQMQSSQEDGALALSHVNTNVRGCADIYFEKIEDETPEDKN